MVTITNGILTLSVTPGAFRDIYSGQGYKEILSPSNFESKINAEHLQDLGNTVLGGGAENTTEAKISQENRDVSIQDESEDKKRERLEEIPLNEMTSRELKEYAKILGVDIRGLNSKTAVKDKIRSVL